jgi:hypothetical protein
VGNEQPGQGQPTDGQQPAQSIDGEKVSDQADGARSLADLLNGAADAVAGIGVMLAMRNPGSLYAQAKKMVFGEVWGMGARMTAGLLGKSAASSDGAVDLSKTAESNGMSKLSEVNGVESAKLV